MLFDEFSGVQGLSVSEHAAAPVMEEVGVVYAYGDYQRPAALLQILQGYADGAFLQGQQGMFWLMTSFRENAERNVVGEGVQDFRYDIQVLCDLAQTVAAACQRYHPGAPQPKGCHGV